MRQKSCFVAANTFQRVGLALSMAGSVVSASFWRVDVHSTVLPTHFMRHLILSGLGALPWLDLCVRVDRVTVASFVLCFREDVSQRRIARLGPRDCVGIGFGCSMSWRVRWVCVC